MSLKATLLSRGAYLFYMALIVFACAATEYWQQHRYDAPGVELRANACLSRFASSASSTGSALCFTTEITNTLTEQGLVAAFKTFKIFYTDEPLFRGITCHNAGHTLGAAAYDVYKINHVAFTAPEASYCGYGFYHGFMEKMLVTEGPGQYAAVREYCASLGQVSNKNPQRACDHGIGHALFDSLPSSLYGKPIAMVAEALSSCEDALPGPGLTDDRIGCATGVFNSLANAFSAKQYRLAFTGMSSLSVCKVQRLEYQPGCYSEVGVGFLRDSFMTRTEALALIESVDGGKNQANMLIGYAGDEMSRAAAQGNPTTTYTLCTSVPSDLVVACIKGIMNGIFIGGSKPGVEYESGFTFCKNGVSEQERPACYKQAITSLGSLASDRQAFMRTCVALPGDLPRLCPRQGSQKMR